MRIAVASTGKTMKDSVDPRFGRAHYILIVDPDARTIEHVIDNQSSANMAHGAGIQVAANVVEAGVGAVLSGFVGPKAFMVLSAAGLKVYSGLDGTVEEAVEKFVNNAISPDSGPSSNGHSFGPRGW